MIGISAHQVFRVTVVHELENGLLRGLPVFAGSSTYIRISTVVVTRHLGNQLDSSDWICVACLDFVADMDSIFESMVFTINTEFVSRHTPP